MIMAAEDHGKASTYDSYGCRCQDCLTAHAARVAAQRERRRLNGRTPPVHGLNGYTNYGCRCFECSAAMHDYHEAQGLDDMIDYFNKLTKRPGFKVTSKFEKALSAAFAHTQAITHVISGRLKASGYTESDFKGGVWSGTIHYGGPPGTPAYYAIYEQARGGTRPDGTPHDFFSGLGDIDPMFEAAIDTHFEP
jgi:hypothetical protein